MFFFRKWLSDKMFLHAYLLFVFTQELVGNNVVRCLKMTKVKQGNWYIFLVICLENQDTRRDHYFIPKQWI